MADAGGPFTAYYGAWVSFRDVLDRLIWYNII